MIKKTPTARLSEQQWQELRRSFSSKGMVGGSDASTLLGLNPYKSPINMYYQAINPNALPSKMNGPMLHGKMLEEYVAKCWQYHDGTEEGWINNTLANNKIKKFRKVKAILENTKYPMLFANVDGIITSYPNRKEKGILEIKTISGYASDMYEAGIPPSYLIQVQHYMIVMGLKWAEICYLKDGRDLGIITIEEDVSIQERIIQASQGFYDRVQTAKTAMTGVTNEDERIQIASEFEPLADDTAAFNAFISEKHKARENEATIEGTDEHEQWAYSYKGLSAKIKELESEKQLFQNRLKQVMEQQGATIMELPNGKITWRKVFNIKL